ncbi:hypothetical protein J5X84_19720 [Streptosporangiaceae bacterium NEAU-GS5]|nr:hypothetical protein [Streptosporangiaceae bacterium NEAU-GS5]
MDPQEFEGFQWVVAETLRGITPKAYKMHGAAWEIDDRIMGLVDGFERATMEQRAEVRAGLTDGECVVLGRYGHYAAGLALGERSERRLTTGIVCTAMATSASEDWRDVMVTIAQHHFVADELGVPVVELFDRAAEFADERVRDLFRAFGRRTDITLEAFGWRVVAMDQGKVFHWF